MHRPSASSAGLAPSLSATHVRTRVRVITGNLKSRLPGHVRSLTPVNGTLKEPPRVPPRIDECPFARVGPDKPRKPRIRIPFVFTHLHRELLSDWPLVPRFDRSKTVDVAMNVVKCVFWARRVSWRGQE